MLVSCHQPDKTLITTEHSMHLTDKEAGKSSVYWVLTMMYRRGTLERQSVLFGLAWFRTKCGNYIQMRVTTVVAPGATELHLVQLLS